MGERAKHYRGHSRAFSAGPLLGIVLLGMSMVVGLFFWQKFLGSKLSFQDRFNFVIIGKPVVMVSVSLAGKNSVWVVFPDDLYISEVAGGYGGYRISSVFSVGELDKRGPQTVSDTVASFLGVPVDGYLLVKGNVGTNLRSFFLNPRIFGLKTNIFFLDIARLIATTFQQRVDRVKTVDLTGLATPIVLADGSQALSLESAPLDQATAGLFTEGKILDEKIRLLVVNTTGATGLGTIVARTLSNLGSYVVGVESNDSEIAGCEMQVLPKFERSVTIRRLLGVFGCRIVVVSSLQRSDAVLFLGKSSARQFGKIQ